MSKAEDNQPTVLNPDELVLTTIDNPYNPRTDYELWKQWDEENEYNTEAYIGRLLLMEDGFDIDDEVKLDILINKVIADIMEHDMLNVYVLV